MEKPRNETEKHYLLKQIGKYILWRDGYKMLGTEVGGMYAMDFVFKERVWYRPVIDVVGVRKEWVRRKGAPITVRYYVKGIEAKVSLSDFRNGFCAAPQLTSIIAPSGVIPVDMVPDKIGLIEVDFDEFDIRLGGNTVQEMRGVYVVKKPEQRLDSRFADKEAYQRWARDMLEKILYRCSQELLFWQSPFWDRRLGTQKQQRYS